MSSNNFLSLKTSSQLHLSPVPEPPSPYPTYLTEVEQHIITPPPCSFESLAEYRHFYISLLNEERAADEELTARSTPPVSMTWSLQKRNSHGFYNLVGTFQLNDHQRTQFKLHRGTKVSIEHPGLPESVKVTGSVHMISYRTDDIQIAIDSSLVNAVHDKLAALSTGEYVIRFVFDSTVYDRVESALEEWHASPALQVAFLGSKRQLTLAEQTQSQFLDPHYIPTLEQIQNQAGRRPLTDRQAEAIYIALSNPITSVQGPPGSGKSSTLSVLVTLLSQTLKRQYESKLHEYNTYLDSVDPYDVEAFVNHIVDPAVSPPKKPSPILVCAPSNVASDHLALLLITMGLDVVRISSKRYRQLKFEADDDVENSTLHRRVQAWLLLHPHSELSQLHYQIFGQLDEFDQVNLFSRLDDILNDDSNGGAKLEDSFDYQQFIQRLSSQLKKDSQGFAKNIDSEQLCRWRSLYGRLQSDIIGSCDVLCTTFANAGNRAIFDKVTFHHVILDEVSQSTEPQLLLPLMYRPKHLVLFGDQQQLGPVVQCQSAGDRGLARSLFVRLLETKSCPTIMLSTQFRMHPAIAHFSSTTFYNGELGNGVPAEARHAFKDKFPWPNPDVPLCFINTQEGKEDTAGTSKFNQFELDMIEKVLITLINSGVRLRDIGVVIPYNAQSRRLLAQLCDGGRPFVNLIFQRYFDKPHLKHQTGSSYVPQSTIEDAAKFIEEKLEIDSVDSYQGREKPIMIFNTVRSSPFSLGFLKDPRRLNVGLTRAQHGLIVIGSAYALNGSPLWKNFIDLVRSYGGYINLASKFATSLTEFQADYRKRQAEAKRLAYLAKTNPQVVRPKIALK